MSALSIPSSVETVRALPTRRPVTVRCSACHGMFDLPEDSWVFTPNCPACQHSHAMAEAVKLLNDVIALRDGTGVFKTLSLEERREQLQAFGLEITPKAAPVLGFKSHAMAEIVRDMASDMLVDLAGLCADQISVRLGSTDVAPADRHVEPVQEPVRFIDDSDFAPGTALRDEIEHALEDQAREMVLAQEAAEQDPERWDSMA